MEQAHRRTRDVLKMVVRTVVQLLVDCRLLRVLRVMFAYIFEHLVTTSSCNLSRESSATIFPLSIYGSEESDAELEERFTLLQIYANTFDVTLMTMLSDVVVMDDSNILPVLILNDFFESWCKETRNACFEFLKTRSRETNPLSNALVLLGYACSKEEDVLVDVLSAHICSHLYHFSKDVRLMEMSFDNFKALLVYGRNFIVSLPGSSDVLLTIIHKWINCNLEERIKHRCELMGSIALSKVSSEFPLSLIMRLENAAYEAECSNGVQLLSNLLKTLEMGIDLGNIGGNARLNGLISLTVKNISADTFRKESSPQSLISNLSWKMYFKNVDGEINIGLQCNGSLVSNEEWNCYASARLSIKSHREGRKNFERETGVSLFSSKVPNYIYCIVKLPTKYLINPENGFIEDDSTTITFYAFVQADVPFRRMISS